MELRTFFLILNIYFLHHLIQPTDTHHIVFENIGQMASAVTYIHTKITISLEDIERLYITYHENLNAIEKQLQTINQTVIYRRQPDGSFLISPWNEFGKYEWQVRKSIFAVQSHRQDSAYLLEELYTLKKVLPAEKTTSRRKPRGFELPTRDDLIEAATDHIKDKLAEKLFKAARLPRFVPFAGLALGAMGTFLGMYNAEQIRLLQKDMNTLTGNFNQLVEITAENTKDISMLKNQLDETTNFMLVLNDIGAAAISTRLLRMEQVIIRRLARATAGIQQAQHRRLAVNLLSAKKLAKVYTTIEDTASQIGHSLLTTQPSDLFQLEVTYFFDGQDIQVLVHVPSVAADSMIRLFKLHPLPLPISEQQALIPVVTQDVLGLTAGSNKYMVQLSSTDLMDCHRVNKIFLCERHGVISKHLNDSCLGALYIQNYPAAEQLCHLKIQPIKEIVHQLMNNWFLIYSPIPQTALITCSNGTESQFHLPKGISKRSLSEGCKANFIDHVLYTDSSVKLENDIQHYEWDWEVNLFKGENPVEFTDLVVTLQNSGIVQPTVSDITHLKFHKKSGFNYIYFLTSFILSISAVGILVAIIIFCIFNPGYRQQLIKHLTPNFLIARRAMAQRDREQRIEHEIEMRFRDLERRSRDPEERKASTSTRSPTDTDFR